MRKLTRIGGARPAPLHKRKLKFQLRSIDEYFKLPIEERRKRRPRVDLGILENAEVVERILLNQHGCCAYCEEAVGEGSKSATHYRPPSNAVFSGGGQSDIQYYVWFTYEWNNLLVLCRECRQAKGESFPLQGKPVRPGASWVEAAEREKPLLLDPYRADASRHLMFTHEGEAVGRSSEGTVTIDVIGLNRPSLVSARGRVLSQLKTILAESESASLVRALAEFSGRTQFPGVVEIYLQNLCRVSDAVIRRTESLSGINLFRVVWEILSGLDEGAAILLINRLDIRDLRFRIVNTELDGFRMTRHPRGAYLSSLKIEGFKSLSNLSIEVASSESHAPCLMLLGENATGKSSVLQAVKIALSTSKEKARLGRRWKELTSTSGPVEINVKLQNDDEACVRTDINGKLVTDRAADSLVIGYGARRYFTSQPIRNRSRYLNTTLFNPLATLRDPSSWLEGLDDHKFNAVARALRSILTLDEDGSIVRSDQQRLCIRIGSGEVPIEHLSDGYRSLFIMSIDIMRELLDTWDNLEVAEAIVLIDEVETHLHPRWKMHVMAALRDAMPRVQFICTTHDPLCLRGMKNGEVRLLRRGVGDTVEVHHELPDVSTLRIEQILSSDYFGLSSTEDPEQDYIVRRLAELAGLGENKMTDPQRNERDVLLTKYEGIPYIGSSPDRQIIAEAMTRHLRMNPRATVEDRAVAREESIDAVVAVLKRALEK